MYKIAKEEEKKGKKIGSSDSAPDPKAMTGLMETLWNYTVVKVLIIRLLMWNRL